MDELNLSAVTQSSASTSSGGEAFSMSENESSLDMEVSFDVVEIPADSDAAALAVAPTPAATRNVIEDEQTGSIIFTVNSFPTNPTPVSESATSMSTSLASPPRFVEIRRKSRRRYPILAGATPKDDRPMHSSSPYAQLYFDKTQKTVLTFLEIDIVNGRRKSHSRLPLDAPSPEEYFPWLHNKERAEDFDGLSSKSWSCGHDKSGVSALSGDQKAVEDSDSSSTTTSSSSSQEDFGEPIILSGWMMDQDSMSDEEADIYWLLNDDKDVWVKIDDGCAKALRKLWKSYGLSLLKLKRSTSLQQPDSPDSREEKRLRYSMLR